MKNLSLSHQERKFQVVFDGFLAVFGAFGGVVSLRQGLSDKLLEGEYIQKKSSGLDVKHIPEIKSWFEQHKEPNLSKHLLANSKRSLLHGDYKTSSILAITALERPLEDFIKERCKSKGISKNTLDSYDKNHFIGDYLKLLLPLILEQNELAEWLRSSKDWYTKKMER